MWGRIRYWASKLGKFAHLVYLDYAEALQRTGKLHYLELERLDARLGDILWSNVEQEVESLRLPVWMHGNNRQPERLLAVVELSLQTWDGDILEIGCHEGRMTRRFAALAQQYGRRVMAVDPWQPGTQNIVGAEYEKFLAAIEPYRDVVDIFRASSLDTSVIAQIKQRTLVFAFVDGLHTYKACLQDILTVNNCRGYIAVDDVLWSRECRAALRRGSYLTQRTAVHHPLCREAYLLPLGSGQSIH